MNISTVNELIQSLESAGELSIREQKFLKLAKEFRICSASLDAAIKTGNMLADQNAQLAAENVGLLNFITTRCYVFDGTWTGDMSDYYSPAEEVMPETHATSAYLAELRVEAKSDGVQEYADSFRFLASKIRECQGDTIRVRALLHEAKNAEEFAKQLREGADK